jgi:tetratricopeptide repeat protein 30
MEPLKAVPDGQYTQTIYTLLRDQKYQEVITILTNELQFAPRSRAALSILAYCHFYTQDYAQAADLYDQLTKFYPQVDSYKLYHAQSLFKAGLYTEASKVAQQIENPEYQPKIQQLQVAIQYELEEIAHAKTLIGQLPPDSAEAIVAQGCMLFKEEKYEEARAKFQEALNTAGYQCDVAYNIALCYYKQK